MNLSERNLKRGNLRRNKAKPLRDEAAKPCGAEDSTEGRKVVKVGVQFDRDTMTIGEYIVT